MKTGFYQVTEAPRWFGYVHWAPEDEVKSGIEEEREFDGKIGFLDERLFEAFRKEGRSFFRTISLGYAYGAPIPIPYGYDEEAVQAPFTIPLIFTNKSGPYIPTLKETLFVSFFKPEEVKTVSRKLVVTKVGIDEVREYEKVKSMPLKNQNPSIYEKKEQARYVEDIRWWAPFVRKGHVEEKIKRDVEVAKGLVQSDRDGKMAWSKLGQKMVGRER